MPSTKLGCSRVVSGRSEILHRDSYPVLVQTAMRSIAGCRIVLSAFLILQWVGDMTIFWLPLYYELKVAFVVLLWHPRVKAALFLFDQHLKPLLAAHEAHIDRSLSESKMRALDLVDQQLRKAKDTFTNLASASSSSLMDSVRSFSEQQQQRAGGGVGGPAAGATDSAAGLHHRHPPAAGAQQQ